MFEKHKQPSLEMGLAILVGVVLLFSFAFMSSDDLVDNKVIGMVVREVSGGGLGEVTGNWMEIKNE